MSRILELQLWNSGRPALIDADLAALAKYRWRLDAKGHVIRYGDRRIKLDWAVLGKPPPGQMNEHINRDKLDCRRDNLRVIAAAGYERLRTAHSGNLTGLRGVALRKSTGRYLAHATIKGKLHRLGYYPTAMEAAEVAKRFRLANMPRQMDLL